MSGPYQAAPNMGPPDSSDLPFQTYNSQYGHSVHSLGGLQPQLDRVAFWYRPDDQETMYESSMALYGRAPIVAGAEQPPKHRRTRSGCFTCRSRRVKCDETRPTCDRCKKGNRECDFPQPTTSKRARHAEQKSGHSHTSPKLETLGGDSTGLDTIKDESDEEDAISDPVPEKTPFVSTDRTQDSQALQKHRQHSQTSTESRDKPSPPSTDTSGSLSRSQTPASSLNTQPSRSTILPSDESLTRSSSRWSHLRPDMQTFLQFQHDHMTYNHYFFKLDHHDFIHNEFIDLALTYEPLLYAVVAFAAYHHTLRYNPGGDLSTFIPFYSKSLSLLRRSLQKTPTKLSEATVLTVLQLATFEEYLGDWVNLVGHHRAAHHMLTDLYTPETVMITETSRSIFAWYARLDVIAGLMAGNETILERKWYETSENYWREQIDLDDVDIENSVRFIISANRLIGMDMAMLFSKLPRGAISMPAFVAENAQIVERLALQKKRIESLNDEYYTLTEFPYGKQLTEDDIVDPYIPGGLFVGPLWTLNQLWMDWYGIELMHRYQTSIIMNAGQQPQNPALLKELQDLSREQCRIYETIDRYPDAPEGCTLTAHASLGIAIVFLPKDARHTMWARRKLADVEKLGYIFPPAFRAKMAEMWGEQSVENWWLDDDEGLLPVLRECRKLGEERVRGQGEKEGVRDIRALFAKLDMGGGGVLSDGDSPKSDSTLGSGVGMSPPAVREVEQGQVKVQVGRQQEQQQEEDRGESGKKKARSRKASRAGTTGGGGDRMSGVWNG